MKNTEIPFTEFQKLDLRIGKITEAEQIPSSRNLIRITVDFRTEKRQAVAGLLQWYKPEELVGKDIVVVANLVPAKIFGIESNGMVLAAGDAASLLVPLKPVEPGSKIR